MKPQLSYLTNNELAELIGCASTSHKRMRRWLTLNSWPYFKSSNGSPRVSRVFHDSILCGKQIKFTELEQEPDFGALKNDKEKSRS